MLILLAAAAACGGGGGDPAPPAPAPSPPAPPAPPAVPSDAATRPEPLRPAPWSAAPLTDVPAVYVREWSAAENRETCALLAVRDTGREGGGATPRAARFGGGWGVAYDLPGLRSAFGLAGTGAEPGPTTYDDWPYRTRWADGSSAGWGPEGGGGPNQLAYLRVAGQRCLYNVWSRLGREHLERLLAELRWVETPAG